MNIPRFLKTSTLLLAVVMLAACGSNSGSDSSAVTGTGSTSGISAGVAVDPYIIGAVFQELSADGRSVLQRQSTASDSQGRFVFTRPLTPGSQVVMKAGSTGIHVGAPFQGVIKRNVEAVDSGPLIVSPLTTLLANGMTRTEVVSLLTDAGFTGISEADLTDDPMAGLAGHTGTVSDASLELLRASMTVNTTLDILNNYDADYSVLASYDGALLLGEMAATAKDTLSSTVYDSIKQDLALDPTATAPLQLGDVINASVEISRAVATQIKTDMANNGGVLSVAIIDDAVQAAPAVYDTVRNHYQSRMGSDPAAGTDPIAVDGQAVFDSSCASCHNVSGDGTTMDLSAKGTLVQGKFQPGVAGHMGRTLTAAELDALIAFVDGSSPAPTPDPTPTPEPVPTPDPVPVDGQTVFSDNCASCHNVGGDGTTMDLAVKGSLVATKFQPGVAGHMGKTLSAAEIDALTGYLDAATPAPAPDPVPTPDPGTDPSTPVDGPSLYAVECASCHGDLTGTDIPGRSAAQIQAAIDGNIGGMGGIVLSSEQLQAIADALPAAPAPEPDPGPAPAADGETLYNDNCASCHTLADYDTAGSAPDLAATGSLLDAKLASGHGGGPYTLEETANLTAWVDSFTAPAPAPDPGPTDCNACHGQPPSDPAVAGAHTVHDALPTIGGDCGVCHDGAPHMSGAVELFFPATYDAKSGMATDNLDGTCSNISCHGGQSTPDWWNGAIDVNSDNGCRSCHAQGTAEYNSYNSGKHYKHVVSKGYGCTDCHNTGKLATGHFASLDTPAMEGQAASTIGGGSTRVSSYDSGSGNCTTSCHGSKRW